MPDQIIRAPILNPRADGSIEFLRDGVIHADFTGRIAFVGEKLSQETLELSAASAA